MRLPRTGAFIDTLRLFSGLTLFLFALTHFLNHALGLWSLDAMATVQGWRLAVTRSDVGIGCCSRWRSLTHLSLALWRIARLKTWRLPRASALAAGHRRADLGRHHAASVPGRDRPARGGRRV